MTDGAASDFVNFANTLSTLLGQVDFVVPGVPLRSARRLVAHHIGQDVAADVARRLGPHAPVVAQHVDADHAVAWVVVRTTAQLGVEAQRARVRREPIRIAPHPHRQPSHCTP